MRVLVTGGAGFIGSHLALRLMREGHSVRVIDNLSTGKRSNLGPAPDIELVEGDVRSREAVGRSMEGVDAVFHLAALPSVARSWADPVTTLAVNGLGTANVVEGALAAGAQVLVYSSSSSVYGDQDGLKKSEELEPRPISPYGFSKLLGEKIALAHARGGDLRVVSLRYFNVFGPRQDPSSQYSAVIPRFIKHALDGTAATIDGDGLQDRDFTFVENVVQANVLALKARANAVAINIAAGESRTLNELVDAIVEVAGVPLRVSHGDPRPGDIRHSLSDLTRARTELGYQPVVSFKNGLKQTYESFRTR